MNHFYYQGSMMKLFKKSVLAVNPAKLILENVKIDKGNLYVCDKVYNITDKHVYLVGFGKAVLGMASQCEKILGDHLKYGVICGPHNIQDTFKNHPEFALKQNSVIQVHEGAKHNIPDNSAEKGADAIINLVQRLNSSTDYLIVLISGGGSALFPKPKPGLSLADKLQAVNLLMTSGADIQELNIVRKKLSMVKGGGLAALSYPVKSICLIISDVINDHIDIIASGPTVPNFDTHLAAINVLQKYNLENKVPKSILHETKKSSSEVSILVRNKKYPHVENFVIGNNQIALNAAKKYAEELGFQAVILSNQVRGTVQSVADFYRNMIFEVLVGLDKKDLILNHSLCTGCCFDIEESVLQKINLMVKNPNIKTISMIAGGETTITVVGNGKGGRNQELALTLSVKMFDLKLEYPHLFDKYEVKVLCAGTDGIDGPTDAAGAFGDLYAVEKARKLGIKVQEFLLRNDSNNFFNKIDDGSYLIKTGHTGTNVMDIHIILIFKKELSN